MTFEMIARCVSRFVLIAACAIALTMPGVGGAAEEPRLDLQATASRPLTAEQPILWTIRANNGGRGEARGATAAWKTFFDSGVGAGVVIFDEIPRFRGVPLALADPPTVKLEGVADGVTAGFYYSASREIPSAPKEWSAAYMPDARWIALLLSGGSGNVQLPAAPRGSGGAGAVWKPQVTIAFSTKQPSGVCAREDDAVTNMANGVVADAAGMLLGPGITAGTRDGAVSLAAAVGNGRPGSGPLRATEFRVRRHWWIFGRERCVKRLPIGFFVRRP
jgi:hypothetical protein